MRILLTNDDGITAPGLVAMYRRLCELGDVDVVAPETVQSATSHGITIHAPLMTARVKVGELFEGTAVAGRPADCVKLAVHAILPERPDLVVSGINSGANTGINVIYSGTVAAAIEAAFLGLPAIALSQYLRADVEPDYDRAADLALRVIRALLERGIDKGGVVSVNLPVLAPAGATPAVKVVRQCTRSWGDEYEKRLDPRGREYFWNSATYTLEYSDDDTDVAALREGYVTITPLQFDLTHYPTIQRWQEGRWEI